MKFKPNDHWFLGPPSNDSRISMRLTSWSGGKCPVAPTTKVYALLRSGDIYMYPQEAGSLAWGHLPWWLAWAFRYERALEIVGYRVALQTDNFDGYERKSVAA